MANAPTALRTSPYFFEDMSTQTKILMGAGAITLVIAGIWAWTRPVKESEQDLKSINEKVLAKSPEKLSLKIHEELSTVVKIVPYEKDFKTRIDKLQDQYSEVKANQKGLKVLGKSPEKLSQKIQEDLSKVVELRLEQIAQNVPNLEPDEAVATYKELQSLGTNVPALQPRIEALSPKVKKQATPKKMRIKVTNRDKITELKQPQIVQELISAFERIKVLKNLTEMEKLYLQMDNFLKKEKDDSISSYQQELKTLMIGLLDNNLKEVEGDDLKASLKLVCQIEQSAQLIQAQLITEKCLKLRNETILAWVHYRDEEVVYNTSQFPNYEIKDIIEKLGWEIDTELSFRDFLKRLQLLTVGECKKKKIATFDQLLAYLKDNRQQCLEELEGQKKIELETPMSSRRKPFKSSTGPKK